MKKVSGGIKSGSVKKKVKVNNYINNSGPVAAFYTLRRNGSVGGDWRRTV